MAASLLTRRQYRSHRQVGPNNVNILPANDLSLLTLGRLTLRGSEGDAACDALRRQRRKLAVLAVLALAREPVSRDALIDMFWGEQKESLARHSLSEALSHLRRVLGPNAITARGAEVELDPHAPLTVDARDLDAAVAAERWGDAIGLYGGAFMDGVHPGDSARLEAWIARERRRLELLFVRACEREYAAQRAAECWDDAASVARRWTEADPLSEAAALALLRALEAPDTAEAGARAFQAYEALRVRLMREFGAVPGERVQARAAVLAERLSEPAELPAAAAAGVSSAEPPLAPATSGAAEGEPARGPPSGPGRFRRRTIGLVAGTGALVVAVALGLIATSSPAPAPSPADSRVAVLPFSVQGPTEYAYLGEGVMDLLSANLDGAGPFRTVNPQAIVIAARATAGRQGRDADVARRVGAALFVRGNVVVAGGRLRISAGLFECDPDGRRVADATVDGVPDDLFRLVDRLTAQLLAASGSPVPPLGRLAALTTGSLPALKEYLEGESDFRAGLYASAYEAFRHATELDSTFALAHYRMAQAANWAVAPGWVWDSIVVRSRLAAARADRLAPRTRMLVHAYAAWVDGAYDDAERGYRAVVRTYPEDVEAWYGLGEVLFHTNPIRGRSIEESGEAFERVLVLEPRHLGALTHLLRVGLRQGRSRRVDSLVARLDSLEPPERMVEYRALRAFAYGTESDRAGALAELRASDNDELVRVTAHRVAVYAGNLDGAARALPLLLKEGLARDVRAHAHVWLAELEVARGRWRAADRALDAAAALHQGLAVEVRALLAALPFAPDGPARAVAAQATLTRWDAEATPRATYPWFAVYDGIHGTLREYLLGLLELRGGSTGAARQRAAVLASRGGNGRESRELARGLSESLYAHAAAASDRSPEALARFDAARLRVSEGLLESQIGSQAYERWARAELLFRTGRLREALPWYATVAEGFIDGLIYLAPAEARQAAIYERLGDGPAAMAHYTRFLELWSGADPELGDWVAHARSRLRALRPSPE